MHRSNKLWMLQTGIRCDKIEVLKIKAILLTLRKSIRTIAPPPVRDGVWVKVRVSFRVGGQPDKIAPEESPPGMVRVSFSVSFAVGEGNCPRLRK